MEVGGGGCWLPAAEVARWRQIVAAPRSAEVNNLLGGHRAWQACRGAAMPADVCNSAAEVAVGEEGGAAAPHLHLVGAGRRRCIRGWCSTSCGDVRLLPAVVEMVDVGFWLATGHEVRRGWSAAHGGQLG